MSTETERLDYIDTVKGIGILLVMVGHHLIDVPHITNWINSFHMPMFFILTGFLAGHNAGKPLRPIKEVLVNKAKRLLYPYTTFSILVLCWYILFYYVLPFTPQEDFQIVALKTVTTYGYHALWFLPAMFCASLLFEVFNRSSWRFLYAILCLFCGILSSVIVSIPQIAFSLLTSAVSFWQQHLCSLGISRNILSYTHTQIATKPFLAFSYSPWFDFYTRLPL